MESDIIVERVLGKKGDGMTITEIVDISGLFRATVRIALARLEGAQKVTIREVGMAKIYSFFRGSKI